jgi:hypothetical protein
MKKGLISVFMIFVILLFPAKIIFGASDAENLVQMAILLDTSNSMDGLIEQAKSQLWKIVNELALAKRNGKSPDLHVALYEYGKSTLPASEGHLRMVAPLTTDLDKISEELFRLKTNGGDEYCGHVIQEATKKLKWSTSNNVYKVIFIAGNEPFTQGRIDYKSACKEAISRGIIINTIFCGNHEEGLRTNWRDGADLADGKYMNINQDQKIVHIEAPQDEEIARLGKELNNTYIAFGAYGTESLARQEAQDINAASAGKGSFVQRAMTKSKKQYKNEAWDLVDAEKAGSVNLETLEEEALPEEMRKMSKGERKKYVEEMAKKREKIQKRINELSKERRAYIEKERGKLAEGNTLDAAIINAVHEQALGKNFKFE